jgi:hypothetical protein
MNTVTLTQLQCQIHNPLLMVRGCNPIPEEAKKGRYGGEGESNILWAYTKFQELYQEALKQAASKNLVFGLEVDYADTNQGLGGFFNAGYLPENLFSQIGADWEKDFRFHWPRDPHSREGKHMRYQGSINLGVWPRVVHDAMAVPQQYWKNGKSFVCSIDISKLNTYEFLEANVWMHLFTSLQNEYDNATPDCSVRFTLEFDFTRIDEGHKKIIDDIYGNKHWTPEQIREKIVQWQEANTVKSDMIVAPNKFFANIRPRFYYDGPRNSARLDDLYEKAEDDKGANIFKYGEGDCHVYGPPHSQQSPKRYISPDSYNGIRALAPMFAFNDDEHDMTHQFYADALMMDEFSGVRAYCKLDSSCT